MGGTQPFQFKPTYPPGEEPVYSEEERDDGDSGANFDNRVRNTEWCICGGNSVPMSTADKCFCCQGP